MNAALELLQGQRQQLGLDQYSIPGALTSVVLTPRFQASSHIVYLIFGAGSPDPLLVVKMPRLAGKSMSISREARNLHLIQSSRLRGFDSVPRLVTHQVYYNREILVETALSGRAMDPGMVRQSPEKCCDTAVRWLLEMGQATRRASRGRPGWFYRLVKQPLDQIGSLRSTSEIERDLLARTWKTAADLEFQNLPLVFEHGDLSHPNIFLLKQGGMGVVDWEQADPEGLPVCDLFFFLTYVAFARHRARRENEYLQAFQSAFFGKEAWAVPYIRTYARQLDLPAACLSPLLVLTWPRYLSALLDRLMLSHSTIDKEGKKHLEWLQAIRYHRLWQFAVQHYNELEW